MTTGRRWLIAAAAALVTVSGLCSGRWWHGASRAELDAELDALRERGEPAGIADVIASVGDTREDGGRLLEEAWEWLESEGPAQRTWPDLCYRPLRQVVALPANEREQFARDIEPFLARVTQASACSGIPLRPALRVDQPIAELGSGSILTRTLPLLATARSIRWRDESPRTFLELLRVQSDLSAHFAVGSAEPALRRMRALCDTLHVALEVLSETTVPHHEVRSAVLSSLDVDAHAAFRYSLRAERAVWLSYMRRLAGDEPGPIPPEFGVLEWVPWASRSTRAGAIEWTHNVDQVLAASARGFVAPARLISSWPGRPNSYWAAPFDQREAWHAAARILPPYLVRQAAGLTAMQRICRVAIASAAHREANGTWPDTVDDLHGRVSPADLIDPFTGEPLEVVRTDHGVRVGSVGCRDAEIWGATFVRENDPEADGLVWTLRR